MAENEMKRTCFIITPIGEEGSETRQHIDDVIDEIVIPAFQDKYEIIPPHRINKIGSITEDTLEYIRSSDLVVANLTGLNPNVMYELGYRHCVGKPVIVIALDGTKLPFDIKDGRTFYYKDSLAGARKLREQLVEVEGNIDYDRSQKGETIPNDTHSVAIETTDDFFIFQSSYRVYIKPAYYDIMHEIYELLSEFEEMICSLFSERFNAKVSFLRNTETAILFVISFFVDDYSKAVIRNDVDCIIELVGLEIESMSIS